jgi:hypothetical protein
MPKSPVKLSATAAAILLASAYLNAAPAATCTAEVMELAQQYALTTDLPEAGHEKGVPMTPPTDPATVESRGFQGTDRQGSPLARSGGVIQPPRTGTMPTIAPPPGTDSNMPTAPGAAPGRPAAPESSLENRPGLASAEDREKAEALLAAARIADEEGRVNDCRDRLEEARSLLPPQSAPQRG